MPTSTSETRTRVTISLPTEIAAYLRSTRNASALVCDAIREYRARELARRLEAAYRADRSEAERINADWESADAEVSE